MSSLSPFVLYLFLVNPLAFGIYLLINDHDYRDNHKNMELVR